MVADAAPVQEETPRPRPRWGVIATILWAAAAAVVTLATQVAVLFAFLGWWQQAHPGAPISPEDFDSNGALFGVVTVVSTPVMLAFLYLAVRLSRVAWRDYLAIKWPSRRLFLIGLALIAVLLPVNDLITAQSGREVVPPFMTDTYTTARDAGAVFLLLYGLSLTVMAPLGEEIAFRGFLYRGFAPKLGAVPAIAITAAGWSLLHVQYEWIFLLQIFVLGLVFGWLRWRSDSVLLTVILHAIINGVAFLQVALLEGA